MGDEVMMLVVKDKYIFVLVMVNDVIGGEQIAIGRDWSRGATICVGRRGAAFDLAKSPVIEIRLRGDDHNGHAFEHGFSRCKRGLRGCG